MGSVRHQSRAGLLSSSKQTSELHAVPSRAASACALQYAEETTHRLGVRVSSIFNVIDRHPSMALPAPPSSSGLPSTHGGYMFNSVSYDLSPWFLYQERKARISRSCLLCTVVHSCSLSHREAETEDLESEASLSYAEESVLKTKQSTTDTKVSHRQGRRGGNGGCVSAF